MLCSSDLRTLDSDPAAWAWTVKWDGYRAQLHSQPAALWSRQGNSLALGFPDALQAALTALDGRDVVLDCELVVLGASARPDFAALSARSSCRGRAAVRRASAVAPASLIAFDLLLLDGRDVRGLPWQQRRAQLERLGLDETVRSGQPRLSCPPCYDDGPALIRATHELGLEGVVAKRRQAPYVGGRSTHWVKLKHPHARDLQPGEGWRRSG